MMMTTRDDIIAALTAKTAEEGADRMGPVVTLALSQAIDRIIAEHAKREGLTISELKEKYYHVTTDDAPG